MHKKYIPAIDGMRAIAIGLVIASHFGLERFVPGRFGVTLFFFISGYLITGILLEEAKVAGKIDISSFYLRRMMRLAPALIVMIGAVSVGFFLLFGSVSSAQIFAGLFYYTNFFAIYGGSSNMPFWHLWSLAVEEHYYLVYPFIFVVTRKRHEQLLAGLAILTLAVLLWRIILVSHWNAPEIRAAFATDTRIDSILYGALLAVIIKTRYAPIVRYFEHWTVVVASGLLLLFTFIYRDATFRETLRYSLQGIALVPLFYAVLFAPKLLLARVALESPIMTWMGRLSYSLYLYHVPVIFFVATLLPTTNLALLALAVLPVTFALASFSYYFVEKQFLMLREGFRSRAEHYCARKTFVVQSDT